MTYKKYLKNKNLSKNTINAYITHVNNWIDYLNGKNPNKTLFVKYINKLNKKYSANTIRLIYSSIISYFKFTKKWKLINDVIDIKLPSIVHTNKETISIDEVKLLNKNIDFNNWHDLRNYLIFTFMFYTGVRCSELKFFSKKELEKNKKIKVVGKGNKTRIIFVPSIFTDVLKIWTQDKINISINKKMLSNKQINLIIKKIGLKYFKKNITSHSLRRSFATNLLRMKLDIKTVSCLMGHSNINTTSRYIHFTEEEISEKLEKVFI